MKLEAEDLVAQFQHDWPDQYEEQFEPREPGISHQ